MSRLYFDVMILVMPMSNDYISFEIKNEKGYIAGFFEPELNKIFVLGIISKQKGFMKETITELCQRFNTQKVVFTNVLSTALIDKLKNARPIPAATEAGTVLNLEVEWEGYNGD